jgi:two-component system, NarL family, nitrate/nitrite response regulator NarL
MSRPREVMASPPRSAHGPEVRPAAGMRGHVRNPSHSEDRIAVLVIGDDPLARERLAGLLAGEHDLQVAGQVATAEVGIRVAGPPPVCALWDLGLDPATGLAAFRERAGAELPIVVLLSEPGRAADALILGARGVLLRDADGSRLAATLRAVASGLTVLDPSSGETIARKRSRERSATLEPLTARERDVLALLAEGLPNKLIADRLGISEHTAKFHVNSILGKLGAYSRTEAVMRAVRLGLLAV